MPEPSLNLDVNKEVYIYKDKKTEIMYQTHKNVLASPIKQRFARDKRLKKKGK